jgi:hypothetical protein
MESAINLSHNRARRARYQRILSHKWVNPVLYTIISLSALSGLYLLGMSSSVGWLALWPGVVCLIVFLWRKGDLDRIEIGPFRNGDQILLHKALDPAILGRLGQGDLSAYDLWKAIEGSEAHYFMQNRYLIDSSFFEQIVSKQSGSARQVWDKASQLQEKYQTLGYPATLVIASIV